MTKKSSGKYYQDNKEKGWLSIEENMIKKIILWEKMLYYNCKKQFSFKKNVFFWVSVKNISLGKQLVFSSKQKKNLCLGLKSSLSTLNQKSS